MAEAQVLTKRAYQKLKRDLENIIEAGKVRARQAAAQELVVSYWKIGLRIEEEMITTKAGYHNAILRDLSEDLGIKERTLQRTLMFVATYSAPPRIEGLNWSHYRALIAIGDDDEREFYEELVQSEGLSSRKLMTAIEGRRYASELRKSRKKAVKLPRPKDPSFCYKASANDVIDADTLLLDIDLGFEVIKRQRIRLARIDAPERGTKQGKQGRRFVRELLVATQTVVVKTVKSDLHGRYVAHVFYSREKQDIDETFRKGRYLNQELINKGIAKAV